MCRFQGVSRANQDEVKREEMGWSQGRSRLDNTILTRGMRSLTITFAKGLKMGRIQIERYHLHVLRTLREIRHAIYYVLFNEQKHEKGTCSSVDHYSSLPCHKEAPVLIKKFLRRKPMVLKLGRNDWEPDEGESYLLKRAWSELTRPGGILISQDTEQFPQRKVFRTSGFFRSQLPTAARKSRR